MAVTVITRNKVKQIAPPALLKKFWLAHCTQDYCSYKASLKGFVTTLPYESDNQRFIYSSLIKAMLAQHAPRFQLHRSAYYADSPKEHEALMAKMIANGDHIPQGKGISAYKRYTPVTETNLSAYLNSIGTYQSPKHLLGLLYCMDHGLPEFTQEIALRQKIHRAYDEIRSGKGRPQAVVRGLLERSIANQWADMRNEKCCYMAENDPTNTFDNLTWYTMVSSFDNRYLGEDQMRTFDRSLEMNETEVKASLLTSTEEKVGAILTTNKKNIAFYLDYLGQNIERLGCLKELGYTLAQIKEKAQQQLDTNQL